MKYPKNVFNTWTGFPIEKVELDMNADTSRLHTHLDYIPNHDQAEENGAEKDDGST